jgi:hypothetical protein
MTTSLLNTTAHLVARALRARRTVTWQYTTGGASWRFHKLSRSQILKEVRQTLLDTEHDFRFGLEYSESHKRADAPNPLGFGIGAYAYLPEPPPAPPAPTREERLLATQQLHINRIEAACCGLYDVNPALVAKIRAALS